MTRSENVKITLVGDIFPAELPYTRDYGIRTQFKKHKGVPWNNRIRNILGVNDIILGNLESPLISDGNNAGNTFYGDPEFADFLKECGINALNIANNHILEQGDKEYLETITHLNKAGIGVTGDAGSNILYREIYGRKIAIAGFSNVDINTIKNNDRFAVLNENNVIETLKVMQRNKAGFKILCFHWGNEYVHIPSPGQRKMAYRFIDEGADVIAGHHPHVIQPFEKYKNGYIFYSLGNFMFDYIHSAMVSIGLVATLTLNNVNDVNIRLRGVKLSGKEVIEPVADSDFRKFYSEIENLYQESVRMPYQEYSNYYNKLLKNNHLKQRVLMKTAIMKEFFRLGRKERTLLLRNILNYYFNKSVVYTEKIDFQQDYKSE